jgi:hypothetical protein
VTARGVILQPSRRLYRGIGFSGAYVPRRDHPFLLCTEFNDTSSHGITQTIQGRSNAIQRRYGLTLTKGFRNRDELDTEYKASRLPD